MKPIFFLLSSIATGLLVFAFVGMGASKDWFPKPTLTNEIIAVNVVVTSAIYFWLSRIKVAGNFINSYLLSIVLKLGFFSLFLVLVRLASPQSLSPNAILILSCYFVFTFLEVIVLFVKVNK
jgi:hypothetical protein